MASRKRGALPPDRDRRRQIAPQRIANWANSVVGCPGRADNHDLHSPTNPIDLGANLVYRSVLAAARRVRKR